MATRTTYSKHSPPRSGPSKMSAASRASSQATTSRNENEIVQTFIVIPPDGGWGWMVTFVSFICNFTVDGTMYTFGLFLQDISASLKTSTAQTALANSLMTAFYFLSGPVVCALTNKYGFRIVAVAGALLSSIAIGATSFSTTLLTVTLVYGVLGGIGFGMLYVPSVVAIGFYFEKWRAVATSIAASGSSMGLVLFPLIFSELLEMYDWRIKFRILSGLCLGCAVLVLLFRPLKSVRVVGPDVKTLYVIKEDASFQSFASEKEVATVFNRHHNVGYPTAADIHGISTSSLSVKPLSSSSLASLASKPRVSKSRLSNVTSKLSVIYEEPLRKRYKCVCGCCRCYCERHHHTMPTRPLYRDDILYGGSLYQLPQYKFDKTETKSTIDYHLSVTRVTTQRELDEQYECVICSMPVKRILATMLNLGLLKSPSFLLLSFSGFLTTLGLYSPFLFIADRAMANGIPSQAAYYLLSVIGITNTIGRIASGMAASFSCVDAIVFSWISLILCGLSSMASSISFKTWYQFLYASIVGFSMASFSSLRCIIIVDMIGIEKLTNGFGIILLFQGVACLFGVPLASYLKTTTNSYDVPFYYSGIVTVVSGVALIPIKSVLRWEQERKN